MFLGAAVICCVVGLIIILFILFKGKGRVKINDSEVIIGETKDKAELHKEIAELRKIIEKLETNQKK
jgi:hypothetical protein